MPNPIVDLVREEMMQFERDCACNHDLFPPNHEAPVFYPVPFFGDIRRADVLTLALNPSCTEFEQGRNWRTGLDACALTTRLLHYFDLPEPGPHKWFNRLAPAGFQISRSFRQGMAHVDLMSAPTLRPRDLQGVAGQQQRQQFENLVNESASRLQRVLDLACMTKIILVLDFLVGNGNGGQWSVWEKAVEHIPIFKRHAAGNGHVLPILRADNPNALADEVAARRDEIRDFLANGPRLIHANYA